MAHFLKRLELNGFKSFLLAVCLSVGGSGKRRKDGFGVSGGA